MKFRKVIESGIITAALALTSVTTAVSASAAETGTTTESATVNANVADRVSQAASTGVQSVQIIQQNAQAAAEAAEWADKMLVTVDKDSSLNIRKEASADAEVVGKFYAGSGAEVLETGDEWTKVKSGDVEGYVNNAYCVFGEDAHTYAEENCETKATANADGIRVREASNTDAKILDVIDSGASLTVNTDAEEVDGWVSVDCNGTTAYVAADYVDVALNIDDAVSMEEIRAREAAAAQKAAQEAAAQAGNSNSGSDSAAVTTSSEAVSASSSDTQLLAAIIQCEAGGEPYSGHRWSRPSAHPPHGPACSWSCCHEPCKKRIFPEQHFRCYLPERSVYTGFQWKACKSIKQRKYLIQLLSGSSRSIKWCR